MSVHLTHLLFLITEPPAVHGSKRAALPGSVKSYWNLLSNYTEKKEQSKYSNAQAKVL
jgi:hypothetical protein